MTEQMIDLIEAVMPASDDVVSTARGIASQITQDWLRDSISTGQIVPAGVNRAADMNVDGAWRFMGEQTGWEVASRARLPAAHMTITDLAVDSRGIALVSTTTNKAPKVGCEPDDRIYVFGEETAPVAVIGISFYDASGKQLQRNYYTLKDLRVGVRVPDGVCDISFNGIDVNALTEAQLPYEGWVYGFAVVPDTSEQALADIDLPFPFPDRIYDVPDTIGVQMPGIWLDYLYNASYNRDGSKKPRWYFPYPDAGRADTWVPSAPQPNGVVSYYTADVVTYPQQVRVCREDGATSHLSFDVRWIRNRLKPKPIHLLCLGDSVTAGAVTSEPYWQILAKLFMRSDIAEGRWDKESERTDFLSLGTYWETPARATTVTDAWMGKDASKRVSVCAKSGSRISQWLTDETFGFVDDGHFSIRHWVDTYRTYADDGKRLDVGDGTGSAITTDNADGIICCTPTVVYINLTHNGSSIAEYEQMIDDIRTEYPDMPILIGQGMPLLGTWWKELYADEWSMDSRNYAHGPQYSWGGAYGESRVAMMRNWLGVERGEPSENGRTYEHVYYVPQPVVTPTMDGYEPDQVMADNGIRQLKRITSQGMPTEHPGRAAHLAWAIQLYGMLSDIFRADDSTEKTY